MIKKIVIILGKFMVSFIALWSVCNCPVFAGPFTGVGGDADYFPKDWLIGSLFIAPVYHLDNIPNAPIVGIEGIVGGTDLSFSYKVGQQASANYTGIGLRKKIWDSKDSLIGFTLLLDIDRLIAKGAETNGLYMGGIFSRQYNNMFPYLAILMTTYDTSTNDNQTGWKEQRIYGGSLAAGVRYSQDDHWSERIEANYNVLSQSTIIQGNKSILSASMAISYRK